MSMTPEELKKLRRRQRRAERKQARREGVDVATIRARSGSNTITPSMRISRTTTASTLSIQDYTARLIEELQLDICEKPEDHAWLGFSLVEIQRHYPDPTKGAMALLEKATQRIQGPIRQIARFKGNTIGIGPLPETDDVLRRR